MQLFVINFCWGLGDEKEFFIQKLSSKLANKSDCLFLVSKDEHSEEIDERPRGNLNRQALGFAHPPTIGYLTNQLTTFLLSIFPPPLGNPCF